MARPSFLEQISIVPKMFDLLHISMAQWYCLRLFSRLLGLRNMPFVTGRQLNWFTDILPVADKNLLKSAVINAGTMLLFYLHRSENVIKMCVQRKFKLVCTSAQSDQRLHCPLVETSPPWLSKKRPVNILLRLRQCAGGSDSCWAHVWRYLFWRWGSFYLG